jgi:hypothetical protein
MYEIKNHIIVNKRRKRVMIFCTVGLVVQINTLAWIAGRRNCLKWKITVFFGEEAPQLMLRTHRSLKAYCATPVLKMKMRMSSFLPSCTSNGAPVEWNWQGKTDNSEKNLSQCHFVHHKSHMDLTWDRTPGLRGERPATNRLSHGTAIHVYGRDPNFTKMSSNYMISWNG